MAHRLPELWPKPFALRPEGWLPDAPGYVDPPAVRPVPSMAATGAASGFDSRRSRDQRRDRVPRTTHRSRATEPPYRGNRRGGQRTGRRCTRPGDGRAVGQRVTTLTPPGERRLQLIAHPPGSVVTRVIRPAWTESWNHVHGVSSMHSR